MVAGRLRYAISTISFIDACAGIEGSTTEEYSEVYGGGEACLKAGRKITAGVRAGVMLSPSAAVYAKGVCQWPGSSHL